MDFKQMMDWYIDIAKKFKVFEGRARRKEFWTFFLYNLAIGFAVGIVCGIFALIPVIGMLFTLASTLVGIGICVVSVSVGVRRLHDTNKSGWFMLLGLVPIVGLILIYFLAQDSTPGDNQYGPNPKGVTGA